MSSIKICIVYDVQEEFDAEMFDEDHDPTGLKKLIVRKEMECAISENAHLAHDRRAYPTMVRKT